MMLKMPTTVLSLCAISALSLLFPALSLFSQEDQSQPSANTPQTAALSPASTSSTNPNAPNSDLSVKRVVLLVVSFSPDAQFNAVQKELISESLYLRLNQPNPNYTVVGQPDLNTNNLDDLDKLSVLSGADAWVHALVGNNLQQCTVKLRGRDLHSNTDLFDQDFSVEIDPRFRNAFGGLWSPIARIVESGVLPWQIRTKLVFKASPGTELYLEGVDDALKQQSVSESGTIELSLAAPASYSYRSEAPGAKSKSGTIFLERDSEIDVTPQIYFPVNASLSLVRLSYPRIGVAYSVIPDYFEIEAGLSLYTLALAPASPDAYPNYFFSNFRQIAVDAGVRYWLSGPVQPLRFGLTAALELNFLTESTAVINPLVPLSLKLGTSAEFKFIPELGLFADWTPRFSFSPDAAMALSTLAGYGSKNVGLANLAIDMGIMVFEPFQFQVGLRVRP